jgi:hypothetical protein
MKQQQVRSKTKSGERLMIEVDPEAFASIVSGGVRIGIEAGEGNIPREALPTAVSDYIMRCLSECPIVDR